MKTHKATPSKRIFTREEIGILMTKLIKDWKPTPIDEVRAKVAAHGPTNRATLAAALSDRIRAAVAKTAEA